MAASEARRDQGSLDGPLDAPDTGDTSSDDHVLDALAVDEHAVDANAIDEHAVHEHALDEHGRLEPPLAGDELATLTGFLDYQRATFAWRVDGLSSGQLATRVAASDMTLAGMIKHLAYVEDDWFSGSLLGEARSEPWASVDWQADRDWEWHSALADDPDELRALWRASVERARGITARVAAESGLDVLAVRRFRDGRAPSLRWILTHMVEEYARHNGHADLIRESIDGVTGE